LAQVTWFVDRDGIGRLGIEGYFQDLLAGKTGKKEERRDSLGRPIFDEEEEQEVSRMLWWRLSKKGYVRQVPIRQLRL
jgi:DNA-directed RNA polymerase beta subunit